ncbi:hypothetical protein [Tunturibacter empetritectus]|uniref:Uncharacterized protein n=1 Tax=Tunturiibacter lichenicola TaxID=2051959 RepID=A0A7W8J9X9_9BACT|nr:hypothetical protein [Edaphobacter lichenicola]MBB5345146.1 hypothetical protein [Edaphobacter lichenicola]
MTAPRALDLSGRTQALKKEKNLKKLAYFSTPNNHHPKHHVHHANHHVSTTKNHHQLTTFSKTPLKTSAKTAKPRLSPGLHFFSETTS